MPTTRIIPGALGARSLRALLLSDAAASPTARLVPELGGPTRPLTVTPIALSNDLREELEGVRLFSATVGNLDPGTPYALFANPGGVPSVTFVRTLDPAADSLSVVLASCYYDGFHRAQRYLDFLNSAWCRDAAFKILLGDNVYMDVHARVRDDSIDDGFKENAAIYLQHFWHGRYADALSTLPTVTSWDDHEMWNNYPENAKWLTRTRPPKRRRYELAGIECLTAFQQTLNPDTGDPHRSFSLTETPLVDFFLLDVRSQRTRQDQGGKMVPDTALAKLDAWTRGLTRPGVLVIGQPLMIEEGNQNDYNPPAYPADYRAIWQAVATAPFDVLVVSGDVHHSRVISVTVPGGRDVHEFVTSPACHIPSLTSIATGSYSSQGRGSVGFPTLARYGDQKARVRRYHFGTDANSSLATLRFRRADSDGVDVGGGFFDITTGDVANSVRANKGFLRSGRAPAHERCHAETLFTLKKR